MTPVLLSLLGAVAVGAVLPVIPTGAAVSGAAAFALHHHPAAVPLVVLCGAAGAWAGDLVVYAACRWGGERLARRLRWLRDGERVGALADRLRTGTVPVLLVSRLVPGGRVPILVAAALTGLPVARFAAANAPACLLWSAAYAAVGLAGGALFTEPWQAVLAAVLAVLFLWQTTTALTGRRQRRPRPRTDRTDPHRDGDPPNGTAREGVGAPAGDQA
ncbi:hypothetical protein GCM10010123_10490 [Pilimelia anulata]|uniref:VTT domain-containing protein n=1 Tax=Pilimelia anulata TaxID=53371 RepID=A0A8J3B0G5_9ACTN|nr:VTT domain-containing protein [Pilimelia anulata]GGJ82736.1 hypothetical protein GCM10010123_10490 [Pilimelia anulata]